MEVRLCKKDGSLCSEAELLVSRSFAAAANFPSSGGERPKGTHRTMSVNVYLHLGNANSRPLNRSTIDDALLLVDRALTRLYPPLDSLQYLSEGSPRVLEEECTVVFEVQPTAFFFHGMWESFGASTVSLHCVEGVPCFVESLVAAGEVSLVSGPTPSFIAPLDDLGETHALVTAATPEDEDLWSRTRAAWLDHPHTPGEGTSENLAVPSMANVGASCIEAGSDESVRRQQWQIARYLAEYFVNDAAWAAQLGTSGARSFFSRGGTHRSSRGKGRCSLFADEPKLAYCDVIEAALSMNAAPDSDPSLRFAVAKRIVHVDARGIEFSGLLVGYTSRYSYVAVPYACREGASGPFIQWSMVCRLPTPSWLSSSSRHHAESSDGRHCGEVGKRSRNDEKLKRPGFTRFCHMEEAMMHDTAATFVELADADKGVVTIRAHRAFATACGRNDASSPLCPARLRLWFDDVYLVSGEPVYSLGNDRCVRQQWEGVTLSTSGRMAACEPGAAAVHTYCDLLGLVRGSCARYLRARRRMHRWWGNAHAAQEAVTVSGQREFAPSEEEGVSRKDDVDPVMWRIADAADWLFEALTDTMSVHFKKLRGREGKAPVVVNTTSDLAHLQEGCTVEFKAHLSSYHARGTTLKTTVMNVERLRNTLAGMAGARGGVVVVGVTDDGEVIGHPPGDILKQIRLTGFCPAMVKDSVHAKELRVVPKLQAEHLPASPASNLSSDPSRASALPANWWKQTSSHTPAAAAPLPRDKAGERVVTVISVSKGQSPFYSSSRRALPYSRGCASTTPMPVIVMARRLFHYLSTIV